MRASDPQNESSIHERVMRLLARLKCTECGARFDPHGFSLVHRSADGWVLGADCHQCGRSNLVIVALTGQAQPEPASDLLPEEIEAARGWTPLTTNDVLDMHLFLQDLGDYLPF